MYESPFLAALEVESGGRSVPTTPLQVAAPGIRLCRELCGSVISILTTVLNH